MQLASKKRIYKIFINILENRRVALDRELCRKLLSVHVEHFFETKRLKENLKFTKVTKWKILKFNLGLQQYFTLSNVYGTWNNKILHPNIYTLALKWVFTALTMFNSLLSHFNVTYFTFHKNSIIRDEFQLFSFY